MIWTIARKEFLLNLMTFKFAVGLLLCVVLLGVFVPALIADYRQSRAEYDKNVAEREAQLRQNIIYMNVLRSGPYRLYRPPPVLSVFSAGSHKRLQDSAQIGLTDVPEITSRPVAVNPYAAALPMLDVSSILAVVLSLLAVLIASDVVSAERERGTLRLTLSAPVARHGVLLGKILAGLMTLLLPLTTAFLMATLILVLSPHVGLTTPDWMRLGSMYLVSLVFLAAMYSLGLLASCLTRRSSVSLLSALFLWILLVQIVPNAGAHLAAHIDPIESQENVNRRLAVVRDERNREIDEIWSRVRSDEQEVGSNDLFGQWCILVCDEKAMKGRQERFAAVCPLRAKYAEKLWQIGHRYVADMWRQKKRADRLAWLSPITAYENAMSALAGTDVAASRHFIERAREHRAEVIQYLRSKTDDFSSPLYFTQCTKADRAFYQQYLDQQVTEEDFQNWKTRKLAQIQPLDLQDFPRFACRNNVILALRSALADASALALAGILFFVLSFWAFMRYDVR